MAARPKTRKTLEDLFYETLKDIYFAEKQILRALPKMAKAADSEDLRKAFETHRDETEHYEISRYGTLKTWASQLGLRDVAELLDKTLQEEKKTDDLLSQLAKQAINRKAA